MFASNISDAVKLSTTKTKFLVGSFAGSSSKTTGFSPQAIYSENVLDSEPGSMIAACVLSEFPQRVLTYGQFLGASLLW